MKAKPTPGKWMVDAALKGVWQLCPLGHQGDKSGLWADARGAIERAEGR